jgi:hypothetical protein
MGTRIKSKMRMRGRREQKVATGNYLPSRSADLMSDWVLGRKAKYLRLVRIEHVKNQRQGSEYP